MKFLTIVVLLFFLCTGNAWCLAPETGFGDRAPIPLKLKKDRVERPAVYEWDPVFWEKVEQTNPGTLERVKKILATYFDDTTKPLLPKSKRRKPLSPGVDYSFVSGRSVILRLAVPVVIGGVTMKELVIKGAPFKKAEEGRIYLSPLDLAQENIESWKESAGGFEFKPDGSARFVHFVFDRINTLSYTKAKAEYDIGRHCFGNPKALSRRFPVMNVRYTKDKGLENTPLGAVVMASSIPTKILASKANPVPGENRMGYLLGVAFGELIESTTRKEKSQKPRQYLRLARFAAAMGTTMRKFHDAGYSHGNPHANNVLVDMDTGEIQIVDLSEAKWIAAMPREQAFGYRLKDVHYATAAWLRMLLQRKKNDDETFDFSVHILRYFLAGYFGPQGNSYQASSDAEIVKQVLELDFRFKLLLKTEPGARWKIHSPVMLESQLAKKIAEIVFEPGAKTFEKMVLGRQAIAEQSL